VTAGPGETQTWLKGPPTPDLILLDTAAASVVLDILHAKSI
jgi:hypothetical protein